MCMKNEPKGVTTMLWMIAIVLLLLWALGLTTAYTLGGFVHLLVAAAVVLLFVRIIKGSGRKPPAVAIDQAK